MQISGGRGIFTTGQIRHTFELQKFHSLRTAEFEVWQTSLKHAVDWTDLGWIAFELFSKCCFIYVANVAPSYGHQFSFRELLFLHHFSFFGLPNVHQFFFWVSPLVTDSPFWVLIQEWTKPLYDSLIACMESSFQAGMLNFTQRSQWRYKLYMFPRCLPIGSVPGPIM